MQQPYRQNPVPEQQLPPVQPVPSIEHVPVPQAPAVPNPEQPIQQVEVQPQSTVTPPTQDTVTAPNAGDSQMAGDLRQQIESVVVDTSEDIADPGRQTIRTPDQFADAIDAADNPVDIESIFAGNVNQPTPDHPNHLES